MLEFKILKKSKKSKARLGIIKTEHGVVETPAFVPVATLANVKTLDSEEVERTKTKVLIANTFHLHLRPGENIVKESGGLNQFMNWQKAIMTDSAGFQVFSLKQKKIRQEGVYFKSPLDGKEIFIGPKESIKIQEKLGADIIFAFDECTGSGVGKEKLASALKRTHSWAKICLRTKKTNQAIFGIVQGGKDKDLRKESSDYIGKLPFNGFGIGSEFGEDKKAMVKMIGWAISGLPENKPRHLLGVGYVEDIAKIIKAGIDTFDCVAPARFARHGIALTSKGKINVSQSKFLKNRNPLDKKCDCYVCQNYKTNYLAHLMRAKELTGMKLLTFHNLYFFNSLVAQIREKIKNNCF